MLEIAHVWAIILVKREDDHTNGEFSNDNSEDPAESTFSSLMEEDDFDNQQEVLHQDQVRHNETLEMTRDPLPKKCNHADTVIVRTSPPNLRHPAGAIAPPLLNRQQSTINIVHESDIVLAQSLPLPKAGGDQHIPHPTAGGDHIIPQPQKATFEVAKWFMEAILFSMTPWTITSNEKYSMGDEAWQLAIEAQDRQLALAGASVGTPCVCQLPGGPSLKINPQTQEAVSVHSVFCYSIGLPMILNPNNIHG